MKIFVIAMASLVRNMLPYVCLYFFRFELERVPPKDQALYLKIEWVQGFLSENFRVHSIPLRFSFLVE